MDQGGGSKKFTKVWGCKWLAGGGEGLKKSKILVHMVYGSLQNLSIENNHKISMVENSKNDSFTMFIIFKL